MSRFPAGGPYRRIGIPVLHPLCGEIPKSRAMAVCCRCNAADTTSLVRPAFRSAQRDFGLRSALPDRPGSGRTPSLPKQSTHSPRPRSGNREEHRESMRLRETPKDRMSISKRTRIGVSRRSTGHTRDRRLPWLPRLASSRQRPGTQDRLGQLSPSAQPSHTQVFGRNMPEDVRGHHAH